MLRPSNGSVMGSCMEPGGFKRKQPRLCGAALPAEREFKSLGRGGVLDPLQLAPAPDRSRDQHNDDAQYPQHDLAAVAAIGELRSHAERFEHSIKTDADRAVEEGV